MVERHPCGCRSDGTKWLELCPTHRVEHDETHARWQADHVQREGAKRLKEIL